jgi:hypothetical protein
MTTYEIAASAGSLCGLLMVLGGMILLYTGAISLNKTSKEEAATLEFKKLFRLTTHYPALGLFVIGLAFIVTSIAVARPPDTRLTITGSLTGAPIEDPQSLRVSMESSLRPLVDTNSGSLMIAGDPNAAWQVIVAYPGYQIVEKTVMVNGKKTVQIGEIRLVKVAEKPPVNPSNIAPLPPASGRPADTL